MHFSGLRFHSTDAYGHLADVRKQSWKGRIVIHLGPASPVDWCVQGLEHGLQEGQAWRSTRPCGQWAGGMALEAEA